MSKSTIRVRSSPYALMTKIVSALTSIVSATNVERAGPPIVWLKSGGRPESENAIEVPSAVRT